MKTLVHSKVIFWDADEPVFFLVLRAHNEMVEKNTKPCRGGSRIFSRGGFFSKKSREIFLELFFRSSIPSSPIALKRPCFGQNFCAAGKILKNWPRKRFKALFRKFWPKNCVFWRALPPPPTPLKISIYWHRRQGAFKKVLGSVTKYGILKIVKRGILWVGRGFNPWVGKRPTVSAPEASP